MKRKMDKIRSKYAALFSTPEDSTDAQPVAGSEEHEGDMEATFFSWPNKSWRRPPQKEEEGRRRKSQRLN